VGVCCGGVEVDLKAMSAKKILLATICVLMMVGAGQAQSADTSNGLKAAYAVRTLQQWYKQDTGLYAQPTGWWNTANAITVLADYSRATGSTLYFPVMANTFVNASPASHTKDFLNEYNDDEGWWALAWIDSYDLTNNVQYLAMAETIFADMSTQWESKTCGGGIWWTKKNGGSYKNAIANELYLSVAASLANREQNTTRKAMYVKWAQAEWKWFKASGMINAQNLVNDGLEQKNPGACTNNGHKTWSYNQGVILGGLVELYKADHDATLLPVANAIASATIAKLVTADRVFTDGAVHGGDVPQFKGIFVRNLVDLNKATPDEKYKTFIEVNAKSIWASDQGADYEFGGLWQGPFDSGDATRQTSALDVFVAAIAVQ
jgi:predicted alpha-1,6-mannanase (GH76 family)